MTIFIKTPNINKIIYIIMKKIAIILFTSFVILHLYFIYLQGKYSDKQDNSFSYCYAVILLVIMFIFTNYIFTK